MSNQATWFSVRCIFGHKNISQEQGITTYEERIIVLKADDINDAIKRGEEEANDYIDGMAGMTYTGFIDVFQIFDRDIGDKTEVFSLMRDSMLAQEEYLNHFFDSGSERAQPAAE